MVTEISTPPQKVETSQETRHHTVVNERDKCCKGTVLGTKKASEVSGQCLQCGSEKAYQKFKLRLKGKWGQIT